MKSLALFICAAFAYLSAHTQTIAEVRTYGGLQFDEGRDIIEIPSGYLVVGTTASGNEGNSDIYVLKLNDDLSIDWEKILGGSASEQGRSVCLTNSGDYLILGQTSAGSNGGYDAVIYRLTPDGEVVWERHYGTSDWDLPVRIVRGVNLYYVAATTSGFSPGDSRQWLFRINDSGDFIDGTTYDILPEANVSDLIWHGNALYMIGTRRFDGQTHQGILRKLNPSGSVVWEHVLDSTAFMGMGLSIGENSIAATYAKWNAAQNNSYNFFLVGFDLDGNTLYSDWANTNLVGDEFPRGVTFAGDETIQTGTTRLFGQGGSGCRVHRLTSDGIFLSATVFGGLEDEEPWRIITDTQGRILVVGSSNSYGNEIPDVYLFRLPDNVVITNYQLDFLHTISQEPFTGVEEHESANELPWPNPTSGWVNLPQSTRSFQLFDISGRVILEGNFQQVDCSSLPSGVYLLTWEKGQYRSTSRLIVQ